MRRKKGEGRKAPIYSSQETHQHFLDSHLIPIGFSNMPPYPLTLGASTPLIQFHCWNSAVEGVGNAVFPTQDNHILQVCLLQHTYLSADVGVKQQVDPPAGKAGHLLYLPLQNSAT